jgi:hypothetical protein
MLHKLGAEDKEECANHGLTSPVTSTVKASAAIKGVAKRKNRLPNKFRSENVWGKCCA